MAAQTKGSVTHEDIIRSVRAGEVKPVYLLMGAEDYYIDKLSDFLTDTLLKSEERDFNLDVAYGLEVTADKVVELARIIARYTGRMTLHLVPFTAVQEAIRRDCPDNLFTLIMRRFMMRIAQRIAEDTGGRAIITGECLGQVASQTLDALTVTGGVCTMPVFRPLIGLDKEETVKLARKIGTFETSVLPYEDCCTVFTPRHPKLRPSIEELERAEAALDGEALIAAALEGVEKIVVTSL